MKPSTNSSRTCKNKQKSFFFFKCIKRNLISEKINGAKFYINTNGKGYLANLDSNMTIEWCNMKLSSCFILEMDVSFSIKPSLFSPQCSSTKHLWKVTHLQLIFSTFVLIPTVENWGKTWDEKYSHPLLLQPGRCNQCIFGRIKFIHISFIIVNLRY